MRFRGNSRVAPICAVLLAALLGSTASNAAETVFIFNVPFDARELHEDVQKVYVSCEVRVAPVVMNNSDGTQWLQGGIVVASGSSINSVVPDANRRAQGVARLELSALPNVGNSAVDSASHFNCHLRVVLPDKTTAAMLWREGWTVAPNYADPTQPHQLGLVGELADYEQ